MSSLTPIQSVTGYLHTKLDHFTLSSNNNVKHPNLKATASVVGHAALLVASSIETVIRYLIAYVGLALSYALNDKFESNFVKPALEHAHMNKKFFSRIQSHLQIDYQMHIKPFLKNPVKAPKAEAPEAPKA